MLWNQSTKKWLHLECNGLMPTLKYCTFFSFIVSVDLVLYIQRKFVWSTPVSWVPWTLFFFLFPHLPPVETKMPPPIAKSMMLPHYFCFAWLSEAGNLGKIPINYILLIALHRDYNLRKLSGQKYNFSSVCVHYQAHWGPGLWLQLRHYNYAE